MNTLTMALAAVMLAGNAPAKVSGEVEQRVDLNGEWEGTVQTSQWTTGQADLRQGRIRVRIPGCHGDVRNYDVKLVYADEGRGRLRLFESKCLGIYRQQGDHLVICYSRVGQDRPGDFKAGAGKVLLTLRRVKPGK